MVVLKSKKSLEEHCAFVEDLCRISFFIAFKLQKRLPHLNLDQILRVHTPFYYHALELENSVVIPGVEVIDADTAEEFEEEMWESIRTLALSRAVRFYHSSVGMNPPANYNAGSLRYDKPLSGLPANHCNFHIANAVAPDSIFTDPKYLPNCFLELMDKSEREFGYDVIRTCTWLNDEPRFLSLFPREWHDNLVLQVCCPDKPEIPGWSLGNWGQVITARGTFNKKMGEFIRENERLRYQSFASYCSFSALRKHLYQLLAATG